MTMLAKGIAIFDFDGTITPKDSFLEFIKFTDGSIKLWWCIFCHLHLIFFFYLKLYPNYRLKEHFFSFFYAKKSQKELEKKGEEFSRKILPKLCYSSALEVIRWHKDKGHDIYILTASSAIWLYEWCKQHEVQLICTTFETIDKVYTGKISGKNCYGKEKLTKIQPILENYNFTESYGYGDSDADDYYLAKVNKPFKMALNQTNVNRRWLSKRDKE